MSRSWTFQPVFTGGNSLIRFVLRDSWVAPGFCCLLLASLLSLSACGDSSSAGRVTTSSATAAAPPPGSDARAVEAGQLGRKMGPDGLPSLEPQKGVNVSVDTLFTDDIKDPIDRIRRLENAVLELRRDYDATLPSIKRLVGIEKDMQTLMGQLETLTNGTGPAAGAAMEAVPLASVESVPVPGNSPSNSATPSSPAPGPAASHDNDPVSLVPAVPVAQSSTTPKVETAAPSKTTEVAAIAPAKTAVTPPKADAAQAQAPPLPPFTAPPEPQANAPPQEIPKPSVTTAATTALQQAKPVEAGRIVGSGLRLGEDGGKTRLVIDLSGSVTHRTDLDNDEKILVIEINGAGWTGPASKAFSSPVVQSYTTQPLENAKGTRLIVTLKKPATILLDKELPPEATNKNYRLVIDLKGK
ncbi:MAG: hypothetical protein JWO78_1074 [Micavibrio sp.]|nr:hypothetical protein [Micavibrio sp.]